MKQEPQNSHQKFKVEDVMHLNRKDRRRLGKANKIKIEGSSQAHVPESKRKHGLTTITGKKI